jgi:prophage antirepressor-like protein
MNSLTIFQFDNQDIRFVDGKPVANDIAQVLGYIDPAKTISTKVKDKNKSVTKMVTVDNKLRDIILLEEAGIYQLIFSSKLPSAEAFQDWVFEEVLPSIRKTGTYIAKGKASKVIKSAEWIKERQESKEVRRELTDCIKDYISRHPELSPNAVKFMYSNATEILNLGIFNKRTKGLKEVIGLSPSSSLRDYFDNKEIMCLKTIEYLAGQFIDLKDIYPCDAIKQAIELSLTTKKFASKYNPSVKELVSSY